MANALFDWQVALRFRGAAPASPDVSAFLGGDPAWAGLGFIPLIELPAGPPIRGTTDWTRWGRVQGPGALDPFALVAALRVSGVDAAYVMEDPTARTEPPPDDSPNLTPQYYLKPACLGIDAEFAWMYPGGRGCGIGYVDVEKGWWLSHPDLAAAGISQISGRNELERRHGTHSLGVISMVDNAIGGIGIASRALGRVVSTHRADGGLNVAEAVVDATRHMAFGDMMLLEVQAYDPKREEGQTPHSRVKFPAEVAEAVFAAVCDATAAGIVVVAAAGNSTNLLDDYRDYSGNPLFDRAFRDSGAIIVSAGTWQHPHARAPIVCRGSRVDCYAQGEFVMTTGFPPPGDDYDNDFNSTSAAAAIIAGAALCVQGRYQALTGRRLDSRQMRDKLRIGATRSAACLVHGDLSQPCRDEGIGVMPDLRVIYQALEADHGRVEVRAPLDD